MVAGFLRVLRLPPPLKLVANNIAEILLKVALKHQKSKSLKQLQRLFTTLSVQGQVNFTQDKQTVDINVCTLYIYICY